MNSDAWSAATSERSLCGMSLLVFSCLLSSGCARPGLSVRVNPKDGLNYVRIPPGSFQMGCSQGDTECEDNEKPARDVAVSSFWIGATEVTVGAWKKVGLPLPPEVIIAGRALNPNWADDRQPIENTTWFRANEYCRAVGMRLPTEAEWEYAARSGTTGARYADDLDDIAWYANNSGRPIKDLHAFIWSSSKNAYTLLMENGNGPHRVATKRPNGYGLYDMLGNVSEHTADWDEGGKRLTAERGGSWVRSSQVSRVSRRIVTTIDEAGTFESGFRCAGDSKMMQWNR